jgi:hypothetical protein
MEWISTKQKMPKPEEHVLAFWNKDRIEGAAFTELDGDGYWYYLQDGDRCYLSPTHWMPLPEPPKCKLS